MSIGKEGGFWGKKALCICLVEAIMCRCGDGGVVIVGGLLWLGGISW